MKALLRRRLDTYTILILLLIGGVFIAAGALTMQAGYDQRGRQCDVAVEWLEQSAETSRQFTTASRISSIEPWLNTQDEMNTPNAAKPLRWAILDSARFHAEYRTDARPNEPGVLNSPEFTDRIDRARQGLVDHCPETAALLPDAFPMVFVKDNE